MKNQGSIATEDFFLLDDVEKDKFIEMCRQEMPKKKDTFELKINDIIIDKSRIKQITVDFKDGSVGTIVSEE